MPYSYHVDPQVNCVFIRHFEHFGMNILRNSRDVPLPDEWKLDRIQTTSRGRMQRYHQRFGRCKIAWVVRDSASYGLVNQMSMILESDDAPIERRPFYDIVEARYWLGIPEDYEIPL